MHKEIKLYQVSLKTNAIAIRNLQWSNCGSLLQIVKVLNQLI
jgi:hypothetical protein